MKKPAPSKVLLVACFAALAALAMMMWSLFDPRPLQVVGAMSVGQALGTSSFLLYLYVVAMDLGRRLRARSIPPSAGSDAGEQRVE